MPHGRKPHGVDDAVDDFVRIDVKHTNCIHTLFLSAPEMGYQLPFGLNRQTKSYCLLTSYNIIYNTNL